MDSPVFLPLEWKWMGFCQRVLVLRPQKYTTNKCNLLAVTDLGSGQEELNATSKVDLKGTKVYLGGYKKEGQYEKLHFVIFPTMPLQD